jgi:hypothetical protein
VGKDPVPVAPISFSEKVAEQRTPSSQTESKSSASSSRGSLSARMVNRLFRFTRRGKSGMGKGNASTGMNQDSMSTASTSSGSVPDDMSVGEAQPTESAYDKVLEHYIRMGD